MKLIYLLSSALILFSSCAAFQFKTNDMSSISLGMQKQEVLQLLGKPNMVVSAQRSADGDLEILEYMWPQYNSQTEKNEYRPIWIYFLENEVTEWGPGENWQSEGRLTKQLLNREID